jgi:hypothetical protein
MSTDIIKKESLQVSQGLLYGRAHKGETERAIVACNTYLAMGITRSLTKLGELFVEEANRGKQVPTVSYGVLTYWSARYDWVARAKVFDRNQEAQRSSIAVRELETGLSIPGNRVAELKKLANYLLSEVEQGKLYLTRYTQTARGKESESREYLIYNSSLIHDIRGLLEDIAKETGGRIARAEIAIGLADLLAGNGRQ